MPKKSLRKAVLLLLAAFYIISYPVPQELFQLELFSKATVKFYACSLPEELYGEGVVYNGINYEITTNLEGAEALRKVLEPTYQTVIFKGKAFYALRYLRPRIIERQEIAGGILYTCYSYMISGREIMYKGRRVNLQIFEKEGAVQMGSPAIFGSF